MGCCFGVLLLGGAPRVVLLLWWLMDPARVGGTFRGWPITAGSVTAPQWIWPLIGFVLLPWTTVAYVFVSPGGITTVELAVMAIALLIDLGAHGGSRRAYRQRRAT